MEKIFNCSYLSEGDVLVFCLVELTIFMVTMFGLLFLHLGTTQIDHYIYEFS